MNDNNRTTSSSKVPDKPALEGIESKWENYWQNNHTYKFDKKNIKNKIYSIDTPPPTASGSLHVGHVFSYTQTDIIARYQRMTGKTIFYPLGWDDNGLPTERRVQNYYGVRCDPNLEYDVNLKIPEIVPKNDKDFIKISRKNFIELCEKLTLIDEQVFKELFQKLGISVDWNLTYRTIDSHSRKTSQLAFIKNVLNNEAYSDSAPTLWDSTFKTAVAQAEVEDRDRAGAYYKLGFTATDNSEIIHIETTRPELLAACVALVAHPDDKRYQKYFGKKAISPLFKVEIPILSHRLAKPDKGSGIAMICTFGDLTDVIWWRELQLPTRPIISFEGRILSEIPSWISSLEGKDIYQQIANKTIFSAKEKIVELLIDSGELYGDIKPIVHPVNFYEKGDKPLEIITTRQWYIRNGGRNENLRAKFIEKGKELTWYPKFMESRYQNWVAGLNGDWLVSRQRFFGVPIPLWYPLNESKLPDYNNPIIPDVTKLPVDPITDIPPGYSKEQRDFPNGFTADPDILDTWATSSLTPQIVGGWEEDTELFERVFPFDLRPQGHDIIRTWLFSSIVRSVSLHGKLPWKNAALSGWILDPERKKMSKSKGNVVVPEDILVQFGSDAVRYWAASAKLGSDTAYDIGQMKIGRRLAIKILNASKFIINLGVEDYSIDNIDSSKISDPLDQSLLKNLFLLVSDIQKCFDTYNYAKALQITESFFWRFTDNYLELIKNRAYNSDDTNSRDSVLFTLSIVLENVLKLFSPFLPFVTEEVWSWCYKNYKDSESIHLSSWPKYCDIPVEDTADTAILSLASEVLQKIRKAKSEAKVKQKHEIMEATVVCSKLNREKILSVLGDLEAAGNIKKLSFILQNRDIIEVRDIILADI